MGERPLCVSTCLQTFKKHPTCVRFWWSWKVKIHFLSLTSMFSLTSPEVWVQCLICQSLSYFTSSHTQSHLEGEKMCVCVCVTSCLVTDITVVCHIMWQHTSFFPSLSFLCLSSCLSVSPSVWSELWQHEEGNSLCDSENTIPLITSPLTNHILPVLKCVCVCVFECSPCMWAWQHVYACLYYIYKNTDNKDAVQSADDKNICHCGGEKNLSDFVFLFTN